MSEIKDLEAINQQYSNLCAVYGDLMLKHSQLTNEINVILTKINNLKQQEQFIAANNKQTTTTESNQ